MTTDRPDDADIVFEAIRRRRSFKLNCLSPDPIDLTLIERILEAANWAPSHRRTEPWRFVVYEGEARQALADAFRAAYALLHQGTDFSEAQQDALGDRVWQAPVWIALGVEPDPQMPEWEELVAFGCAAYNAQLMACSLGLGCKWTSGSAVTHRHTADAVGFGAGTQLRGFLYLGMPIVPWPEGERRPLDDKVRWPGRDCD